MNEMRLEDDVFPEAHCVSCFEELSHWTSVEDCMVAIRSLEDRSVEGDDLTPFLIVPFPDCPHFQAAFIQCLGWLIKAYRAPEAKLSITLTLDPSIQQNTIGVLQDLRFKPNISIGMPGSIQSVAPGLADAVGDKRFAIVDDHPEVLELIQNPIRCIVSIMEHFWETASKMYAIQHSGMETTGGMPTIFYQPYTDGALAALLGGLMFSVFGLTVGTVGSNTQEGVNRGYRSFEVVGRPPVDPVLLRTATELCERMFASLA